MNKKVKIVLGVFLGIVIVLFLLVRFGGGVGSWKGSSFQRYRNRAYIGSAYFTIRELPKGAKDFKFQCYDYGLVASSYAGFTLSGNDYNDFVASVSEFDEPSELAKEKFIGKKVSDTYNYYNDDGFSGYTGFPKKNVRYTAEGDIGDYTILYYNAYRGHNIRVGAVLVNPGKGRFIVYYETSN